MNNPNRLHTKSIAAAALMLAMTATAAHARTKQYGQIEQVFDRSGKVLSCQLTQTSGNSVLDQQAVKKCQSASVPAMADADAVDQQKFSVVLPVRPTSGKN